VWLGDTPVAVVRPAAGGGSEVFFVWTDQLDTPRVISDDQNVAGTCNLTRVGI
jgi:hypothetical protein